MKLCCFYSGLFCRRHCQIRNITQKMWLIVVGFVFIQATGTVHLISCQLMRDHSFILLAIQFQTNTRLKHNFALSGNICSVGMTTRIIITIYRAVSTFVVICDRCSSKSLLKSNNFLCRFDMAQIFKNQICCQFIFRRTVN